MGTEENFALGLEGVIINYSGLSKVDGLGGKLYYCGYTIEDLVKNCNFEEVSFLLLNKRLPTKTELKEFEDKLRDERCLTPQLEAAIVLTPKKGQPMAVLQSLVSSLAMHDDEIDDKSFEAKNRKAMRIIAKMPTVVTMFDALRKGKPVVRPNKNLSHAANMLYMLTGVVPSEIEEKIFDAALILHMDHGCNASTFTARVVTSTEADIYTSVVAALGSLSGPLHGGANEAVLKMLDLVGPEANIKAFVANKIKNKEKLMGFGHRVYKVLDPRATILRELGIELTESIGKGAGKVHFAEEFAKETVAQLQAIGKDKIHPNVDFFSGAVYSALGLPMDFFTPVFAISRVVGWVAHHFEQLEGNRIYRPKLAYNGAELGREFKR